MPQPIIQVKDVKKRFGRVETLRGVSLDVSEGEVVVIVRPPGSGKTTLLRCIDWLEEYEEGTIIVDAMTLSNTSNINAIRCEIGMVFRGVYSKSVEIVSGGEYSFC